MSLLTFARHALQLAPPPSPLIAKERSSSIAHGTSDHAPSVDILWKEDGSSPQGSIYCATVERLVRNRRGQLNMTCSRRAGRIYH